MEVRRKCIYGVINNSDNINFIKNNLTGKIRVCNEINKYFSKAYNNYKNNINLYTIFDPYKSRNDFSYIEKIKLISLYFINEGISNIIFQNPLKYLDNNEEKQLIKFFQVLKREYKVSVIIITNDTDFLLQNVDYVYIVKNDNIIKKGNKIDIFYDCKFLIENNIKIPNIVQIYNVFYKLKGIKLKQRFLLDDVIKDIYREL